MPKKGANPVSLNFDLAGPPSHGYPWVIRSVANFLPSEYGGSSIGRAPVSKTEGCRFDAGPPCHFGSRSSREPVNLLTQNALEEVDWSVTSDSHHFDARIPRAISTYLGPVSWETRERASSIAYSPIAQLAERRILIPNVTGSSPVGAAI